MKIQEIVLAAVVVFLFVSLTEGVKRLCRIYLQKQNRVDGRKG